MMLYGFQVTQTKLKVFTTEFIWRFFYMQDAISTGDFIGLFNWDVVFHAVHELCK